MASTSAQWPPNWRTPGRLPLSTNPLNPSSGAYYKVLFVSSSGNPRTNSSDSNSTGTAFFVTPWVDHRQFEVDALGNSTFASSPLSYLKRVIPLAHGDPAQTNGSYLYLRQLTQTSFHNISQKFHQVLGISDGPMSKGWPKTEMVAYRGDFVQYPFRLYSDIEVTTGVEGQVQPEGVEMGTPELLRYITKFPETESFHRKIAGFGFAFDSAVTNYCSALASLPEFHQRWIYTSYQWPWGPSAVNQSVPLDYIARTLGTVNSATFDTTLRFVNDSGTPRQGFAAEELRYDDCRLSKPYYGSDGQIYVDVQHVFLWNPFNWNKLVNPANDPSASDRGYEYVKQVNSTGTFYSPARRAYAQRNFHKLFKPRGAT